MIVMKAVIGFLFLTAALPPDISWAASVFETDSSAILSAARANAVGVPDLQWVASDTGKSGPQDLTLPQDMVPQGVIDSVKQAMRNITGNSFSEADLDLLTKMVIRTISVSPFATVSLSEVRKLGGLDPNAKPMVITAAQAQVINDIFTSLGRDSLTPQEQGLYQRAKAEWTKARSNGSVVIRG
jgi:hypothetical protein